MSRAALPYVFCREANKHGYESRAAARKAVKVTTGKSHEGMRPYRCASCGRFHIGHLTGVARKGKQSERYARTRRGHKVA